MGRSSPPCSSAWPPPRRWPLFSSPALGAAAFAVASGVPVVPCAIVGSANLWFRRRIEIRFGEPVLTGSVRGREARAELESHIRGAVADLLPEREPRLPRRRPLAFLTDLLNGADDIARRGTKCSR